LDLDHFLEQAVAFIDQVIAQQHGKGFLARMVTTRFDDGQVRICPAGFIPTGFPWSCWRLDRRWCRMVALH
jgi:hypothetical protein